MRKSIWSAEEDHDLLQRWAQGYALEVIASHLNRTEAATTQHLRRVFIAMPFDEQRRWEALRLDNRVFTQRQDRQMLRDYREGLSVKAIAWKMDCPVAIVQRRLDQLTQRPKKTPVIGSWMVQP